MAENSVIAIGGGGRLDAADSSYFGPSICDSDAFWVSGFRHALPKP